MLVAISTLVFARQTYSPLVFSVYTSKRTWQIYLADPDYHLAINISRNFERDYQHPALSNDGQLAFTLGLNSSEGTEIQILNLGNRTIRNISNERGCSNDYPIWSQNRLLAFVSDCPNELPSIRVLDTKQNKYFVIHDELNDEPVTWLSNDELLFLSNDEKSYHQIYKIHLPTNNLLNMSNNELQNSLPSISPQKRQIAFSAFDPSKPLAGHNIYLWREDKSGLLQITDNNAFNDEPSLSDDGRIVFTSDIAGKSDLYIWSPLTNTISRLTDDAASNYTPIWLSDGRIAYISDRNENECALTIDPVTHSTSSLFCATQIKDLMWSH